jgi:NADPH:quinone reductase-like Zn-dependent oxidoreductase
MTSHIQQTFRVVKTIAEFAEYKRHARKTPENMQQKALLIPTPKADFVLGSHDIPSPGKDKVLVKIMSVALNTMYNKQREFDVMVDGYPAVLGADMAGVVEEVGEDVRGFSKGDRVCVQLSFLSKRRV